MGVCSKILLTTAGISARLFVSKKEKHACIMHSPFNKSLCNVTYLECRAVSIDEDNCFLTSNALNLFDRERGKSAEDQCACSVPFRKQNGGRGPVD